MMKPAFDAFSHIHSQASEQSPVWMKGIMSDAALKVAELGLPSRKNEDWKYTSVDFLKAFQGDWGRAASGAIGIPLEELNSDQVREWLDLRTRLNQWITESSIENLNIALSSGGSYLKVKAGEKNIVHLKSEAFQGALWRSPRLSIFVEENASLVLFEECGLGEGEFANSFIDVQLAPHSNFSLIRLQNSHRLSNQISTVRVFQKSGSAFSYYNFSFGSHMGRDNVFVRLAEENSSCTLQGLSLARLGQHLDQFAFVDHGALNTRSQQLFKSIVSNGSRVVFNGQVKVREGSHGTNAQQLNRNLLLGRSAEVDTRPQLEIANDDVKCSHGASIGRLNSEEIFYLESRGISKQKAVDILCRAFAKEIVLLVTEEAPRARISEVIEGSFRELDYEL